MILTRITQRYQQQLFTSTWVVFLGFLLVSPAATGQQITPAPDAPELLLLPPTINLT